jgi:hypothetical protein
MGRQWNIYLYESIMDYQALNTELTTDPLTRGYSGMTDQQAADDLNTVYRTRDRGSMLGDEIFAATDNAEFVGLSDHKQQLWNPLVFCPLPC